jgi:hypothetical protein
LAPGFFLSEHTDPDTKRPKEPLLIGHARLCILPRAETPRAD